MLVGYCLQELEGLPTPGPAAYSERLREVNNAVVEAARESLATGPRPAAALMSSYRCFREADAVIAKLSEEFHLAARSLARRPRCLQQGNSFSAWSLPRY